MRAVDECIAYQVADIVYLMQQESGYPIQEVRADGGASRGEFLMQFQSDLLNVPVYAAENEGDTPEPAPDWPPDFGLGLYDERVFEGRPYRSYRPRMTEEMRSVKYRGWKDAVEKGIIKIK